MSNSKRPRRGRSALEAVAIAVQLALAGGIGLSVYQLHDTIETTQRRNELAMEMVLATYTLRQSSDYLTRFAREYVVTGDRAWLDVYQQVLDIRRGQALRPKDYESVYWDLIEPYRSNAHPLLYPQSLRSIIETLPFTEAELDLLETAESNSEALAKVEQAAFQAVADSRQDQAIEGLFSIDYLKAKHSIMQPIDELMVNVRKRIETERQTTLAESQRQVTIAGVGTVTMLLIGLLLLRIRMRGPTVHTAGGATAATAVD